MMRWSYDSRVPSSRARVLLARSNATMRASRMLTDASRAMRASDGTRYSAAGPLRQMPPGARRYRLLKERSDCGTGAGVEGRRPESTITRQLSLIISF